MAQDPVAVAASNNPMLTTLTAAVSGGLNPDVDLVDTLNGDEFTVFAPVDDAFAQLPEETVDMLAKPRNADQLSSILTYHVVPGQITPDELAGTTQATVQGAELEVSGEGDSLMVNDANVELVATTLREVHSTNRHEWGAVMWLGGKQYVSPTCTLDVHDRIGGGDGFASGLIYGLINGRDPEEALRLGWAHGALLTTFPGDVTMARLKEVEAFARTAITPPMRGTAFGPEVAPPDGAGALERLVAFTGRAC